MPLPTFRPTKIRIAFGIALVVLSAAAFLSFWDIARVRETALEITAANVVLDRLDDVLEAFRESVSASRGVAPDAIEAHRRAVESMRSALQDVSRRTIDDRDQRQRIKLLEGAFAQEIALETRRLEVAAHDGVEAGDAASMFRSGD